MSDKSSAIQDLVDEGHNKKYIGQTPPSIQVEPSAAVEIPDPVSIKDTLDNAQSMEMQEKEDLEYAEAVGIKRSVDEAENT